MNIISERAEFKYIGNRVWVNLLGLAGCMWFGALRNRLFGSKKYLVVVH